MRRGLFFVLLLLVSLPGLSSGANPVRFEHLTINDGLPENSVRSILQDKYGFLWFGTQNGVARYDGLGMKVFLPDPDDPASIGIRFVLAMEEDADGMIWMGAYSGGLSRYDPDTEQFTNFSAAGDSMPGPGIAAIKAAGEEVWITTSTGQLFRTEGDDFEIVDIPDISVPYGLTGLDVTAKELWVGTSRSGVLLKDRSGDAWQRFETVTGDPASLPSNFVTFVFRDREGRVWVGSRAGLSLYNGDGRFTNFSPRPGLGAVEDNYLVCMTEDSRGDFWIGAASGLYHFDPETGAFNHHEHDANNPGTPVQGPVLSIFCDQSGIIWGGSWHTGLNKYDPGSSKFEVYLHDPADPRSLDSNAIGDVFKDSRGTLWVGTGSRSPTGPSCTLNRRAVSDSGFTKIPFPDHAGVKVQTVYAFLEDRHGQIWLGTNRGLWRIGLEDEGVIRPDILDPGPSQMSSGMVTDMALDQGGRIWVTIWRGGVHRWDPLAGTWTSYRSDTQEPGSLAGEDLSSIRVDSQGRVWLGSDSAGLQIYEPETDSFVFPVTLEGEMASIGEIIPATGGGVLVSTGAGILHCDPTGILRSFTTRTGLPSDYAGNILLDEEGDLWASTGLGLAKVTVATDSVTVFDERDGLPRDEVYFAAFRALDGRLYFGGQNGMISFHPDSLPVNRYIPPVHITHVRILDQKLEVRPDSPLTRSLAVTEEIRLAPDQNDVSLTFAALDYSHPERNRYRYRLDPNDVDWRLPTELNAAHYTNLDPGSYTFFVQGSNSDGIWNENPTTLRLIIAPPWYRTGWANSLFVLLILLFVIGIYRQLLNRERMQMALKMERAEAVHLQNLDHLKSRFFTNISHEFRTPLTLLMSPLQRLQDDPTSGSPELFTTMARNARRLGRLIDQLLDLSRLEADRMPSRWRQGDWCQYLKALTSSFTSLAEQRNIVLVTRWPEESRDAWHDPDLLDKVLVNLLSNALKFTPSGGEVTFSASCESEAHERPWPRMGDEPETLGQAILVTLKVNNTGSYIPPENLGTVFDRFHQEVENTDFGDLGSGIGLALVKELVEWCGGSVGVLSDKMAGTTFTAALPLFISPPPAYLAPTAAAESSLESGLGPEAIDPAQEDDDIEEPDGSDQPTLLVVEDNSDLRCYVREELSNEFNILVAANGKSGLELARNEIPDLVLSDVMMPEMDGMELCRLLKNDDLTSHVPVILLTAKAEPASRKEGLQTGADDYVAKPFDIEELRIRIHNLIAQRRLLAQRYDQLEVARPGRVSNPVPTADDRFLAKAREIIAENLEDPDFRVEALCKEIGMSRTQLHRKLKAVSGRSAGDFLRAERLNKAAEMLGRGDGNVTEVAYSVGYRSLSQFAKAFREQFGMAPSDFEA